MVNQKALQEKIKWCPHEKQQEILNGLKRFNWICAGTRFGKTAVAAYIALTYLFEKNKQIWIVAPTYDLAMRTYKYLLNWLAIGFSGSIKEGAIKMSDRVGSTFIKNLGSNSWIKWKSAENPTSLLGEEVDLVILDECSRIGKEVYDSYVYPRTSSRKGTVFGISTPFGQNWFYAEFYKKGEDRASFHFESKDNPTGGFPQEEWEKAKTNLPFKVFEREYMALFQPDSASVFRGIREIIKDNCYRDSEDGHFYVMGVDLGKHDDFTVLTVIDRYNNNVVYWDRFNQIDYPLQKGRIRAIAERYNNARVIIDSTVVGEPIKEDLSLDKVFVDDFKFSTKSKDALVNKLAIFIEQKHIWIPNEEILINELCAFGLRLTNAGNIIYKAPEGLHDDCVFSLALAVWGLPGQASPKTVFQKKSEQRNLQTKRSLNLDSSI